MRQLLTFFILVTGYYLLPAQDGPPPIRIGVGMMGISYAGDLTVDDGSFQRFSPGGHLAVQFAGAKKLRPALIAGYGGFREQIDVFPGLIPPGIEPNTFVETNFFFADFRLQYYFFQKSRLSPYLAAGVGMLSFSPQDQDGNFLGENIFTRQEGESYNTTIASFPITLGFNLDVNEVISLSLGYTHRFTPSDYLDNIGQLGTKDGNDIIQHFQMGVHFTLIPKDQIDRPPPPQDPDRPLDIVAFKAEDDRRVAFRVPERLDTDVPPNRVTVAKLDQLIETDLKLIAQTTENASPGPNNGVYLTEWQKQEQEAISAQRFVYYSVKPTDQLGEIARRFKTTPQSLRGLNQLQSNDLSDRVYLRIPDLSDSSLPLPDSSSLAQDSSITDSTIAGTTNWLALEEEALEAERYRFIFVSKDQPLNTLATQYHIRLETILKLNYLQSAILKADTYLRIPDLGVY
ncbi:MAG: LysM peptidoglycan-binding domain-containing protein [Bacteroidota bacterium]